MKAVLSVGKIKRNGNDLCYTSPTVRLLFVHVRTYANAAYGAQKLIAAQACCGCLNCGKATHENSL